MEIPYNIIKGGSTSLIALTVTYPIDIWKINSEGIYVEGKIGE